MESGEGESSAPPSAPVVVYQAQFISLEIVDEAAPGSENELEGVELEFESSQTQLEAPSPEPIASPEDPISEQIISPLSEDLSDNKETEKAAETSPGEIRKRKLKRKHERAASAGKEPNRISPKGLEPLAGPNLEPFSELAPIRSDSESRPPKPVEVPAEVTLSDDVEAQISEMWGETEETPKSSPTKEISEVTPILKEETVLKEPIATVEAESPNKTELQEDIKKEEQESGNKELRRSKGSDLKTSKGSKNTKRKKSGLQKSKSSENLKASAIVSAKEDEGKESSGDNNLSNNIRNRTPRDSDRLSVDSSSNSHDDVLEISGDFPSLPKTPRSPKVGPDSEREELKDESPKEEPDSDKKGIRAESEGDQESPTWKSAAKGLQKKLFRVSQGSSHRRHTTSGGRLEKDLQRSQTLPNKNSNSNNNPKSNFDNENPKADNSEHSKDTEEVPSKPSDSEVTVLTRAGSANQATRSAPKEYSYTLDFAPLIAAGQEGSKAKAEEQLTRVQAQFQKPTPEFIVHVLSLLSEKDSQVLVAGKTPLILASYLSCYDAVALILHSRYGKATLNKTDTTQKTALYCAVLKSDEGIVSLLLKADADCAIASSDGYSAFSLACTNNIPNILKLFVKKGVAASTVFDAFKVCLKERKIFAPILRLLISAGLNINEPFPMDGKVHTALSFAIETGDSKIINALAECGAKPPKAEGSLFSAVRNGQPAIVKYLLESGESANIFEPLAIAEDRAVKYQDFEGVVLIRFETPIHVAVKLKNYELLQLLIAKGVDLELKTNKKDGFTALHLAARLGDAKAVEMLINAGADLKATTQSKGNFFTPSQVAAASKHVTVAGMLTTKECSRLKLVFLGHGGAGKTSLVSAMQGKLAKRDLNSTIGIDMGAFTLPLSEEVELQVWDFAGQLEYLPYHMHFLSKSRAIYVIVVTLNQNLEVQIKFWVDYICAMVDVSSSNSLARLILVGSKADLLTSDALSKAQDELQKCRTRYNLDKGSVLVSGLSSGLPKLLKAISTHASEIIANPAALLQEKHTTLLTTLQARSSELVIDAAQFSATSDSEKSLEVLHDIGHIIFQKKSGTVIVHPQVFSKIISLFAGPETHADGLMGYLVQERRFIFDENEIQRFLQTLLNKLEFKSVSRTLLVSLVKALQDFGVCQRILGESNIQHYFLFPALRPPGAFRWISSNTPMNTLAISVTEKNSVHFPAEIFLSFQVSLRNALKNDRSSSLLLYSNGARISSPDTSTCVILSEKDFVILIRGEDYEPHFNLITKVLRDLELEFFSARFLYSHADVPSLVRDTVPFPLNFSKVNFSAPDDLSEIKVMSVADKLISWPWMFATNDISSNKKWKSNPGQKSRRLEIVSPEDGLWSDDGLRREFFAVKSFFEYFVGRDKAHRYSLDKVVLLENNEIEKGFAKTYEAFRKKPPNTYWSHNTSDTEEASWRKWILSSLSRYVKNISGEEGANLILGWHGGASTSDAHSIAEQNFVFQGKSDGGYFGKGMYFTQYPRYGDVYAKNRMEKKGKESAKNSYPLILSWLILGDTYPVTESPLDPKVSLLGKDKKEGFDSHYALVRKIAEMNYFPCRPDDPSGPDYDEIVLFNSNQILPRYLVYYTKIDDAEDVKRTVLWLEEGETLRRRMQPRLESASCSIFPLTNVSQIKEWLGVHGPKLTDWQLRNELCIFVMGSFEVMVGGETAAERLQQWVKDSESPWRFVPFFLLDENSSEGMKALMMGESSAQSEEVVFKFCTSAKATATNRV